MSNYEKGYKNGWQDAIKGVAGAIGDFMPVVAEMDRQVEIWGEQNHHPFIYQNILVEEVGEVSQAILKREFEGEKNWGDVEKELIQVCAVAMSMLKSLRRNQINQKVQTKMSDSSRAHQVGSTEVPALKAKIKALQTELDRVKKELDSEKTMLRLERHENDALRKKVKDFENRVIPSWKKEEEMIWKEVEQENEQLRGYLDSKFEWRKNFEEWKSQQ